ncbi:hypothetical protein C4K25_2971 [Pseudomonas chlororaphis]|nr:hypothetical protein C4K25_2971 [Pseudomonas chlororaphis]
MPGSCAATGFFQATIAHEFVFLAFGRSPLPPLASPAPARQAGGFYAQLNARAASSYYGASRTG